MPEQQICICGKKMRMEKGKRGYYWKCTTFPFCRHIILIPDDEENDSPPTMGGQRNRDPFEAEPWLVAEVMTKVDTMPDETLLKWVNDQYHSSYSDECGNPQKYNKHISWVKSFKTRKRQLEHLENTRTFINEDIDWRNYKRIEQLEVSASNLERIRDCISAVKRKLIKSIPVMPKDFYCPKCGKRMILRTARRGPHAGTQFFGCISSPDCKTTIVPPKGLMIEGMRFDFSEDYRFLYWADYVLRYAGDSIKDDTDIWIIAKNFSNRERRSFYSIDNAKLKKISKDANQPRVRFDIDMKDLDDWLEFKPWIDGNEKVYLQAVRSGLASKLEITPFTANIPSPNKSEAELHGYYMLAAFLWNISPDEKIEDTEKQNLTQKVPKLATDRDTWWNLSKWGFDTGKLEARETTFAGTFAHMLGNNRNPTERQKLYAQHIWEKAVARGCLDKYEGGFTYNSQNLKESNTNEKVKGAYIKEWNRWKLPSQQIKDYCSTRGDSSLTFNFEDIQFSWKISSYQSKITDPETIGGKELPQEVRKPTITERQNIPQQIIKEIPEFATDHNTWWDLCLWAKATGKLQRREITFASLVAKMLLDNAAPPTDRQISIAHEIWRKAVNQGFMLNRDYPFPSPSYWNRWKGRKISSVGPCCIPSREDIDG